MLRELSLEAENEDTVRRRRFPNPACLFALPSGGVPARSRSRNVLALAPCYASLHGLIAIRPLRSQPNVAGLETLRAVPLHSIRCGLGRWVSVWRSYDGYRKRELHFDCVSRRCVSVQHNR